MLTMNIIKTDALLALSTYFELIYHLSESHFIQLNYLLKSQCTQVTTYSI